MLPKCELKFVIFDDLGHKHFWQIFQRVLRVSKIDIWPAGTIDYFKGLNPNDFSDQRNSLHYRNNYWLIPKDLFIRVFDGNFGVRENLISKLDDSLVEKNDFSILVSYLLLDLGLILLKDLSSLTEIINGEYDLMNKTLSTGIHHRYLTSINIGI